MPGSGARPAGATGIRVKPRTAGPVSHIFSLGGTLKPGEETRRELLPVIERSPQPRTFQHRPVPLDHVLTSVSNNPKWPFASREVHVVIAEHIWIISSAGWHAAQSVQPIKEALQVLHDFDGKVFHDLLLPPNVRDSRPRALPAKAGPSGMGLWTDHAG